MPTERKIWAGDGEQLRNALPPGTVLETYDCGYRTVNAVMPDGVLVDTIYEHDHLYDGQTLERRECLIYHQPAEDELPVRTVPKLRSHGGRIPAGPADDAGTEPGVAEERALARTLAAALSPRGFDTGSVRASVAHVNGAWTCAAEGRRASLSVRTVFWRTSRPSSRATAPRRWRRRSGSRSAWSPGARGRGTRSGSCTTGSEACHGLITALAWQFRGEGAIRES